MELAALSSGQRRPVVLDLFCGAGGLSLGFQMAGYHIAMGIEQDLNAARTHSNNFGHIYDPRDINAIRNPETYLRQFYTPLPDVIIGGPPCQGFSRVGRGKLRHLRGDDAYLLDPRNRYWLEFARFVRKLRPFYFVMENVPDLMFYVHEGVLLIEQIRDMFERRLGYHADIWVLHAAEFGVPQTRDRLFIVGNRLRHEMPQPAASHKGCPVKVWEAIGDLPIVFHDCRDDEMPYVPRCEPNDYTRLMRAGAGDTLYNHQTRFHNQQDLQAFNWMPEGGRYVELPARFRRYRADIFEDKYRKLFRARPSWTLEAHIGKDTYRHIYPSRPEEPEPPRTISVREAARLQSFPDRFRFAGAFTKQFFQVGNAVPPLLARAIASAILPGVQAAIQGHEYPLLPRSRGPRIARLQQRPLLTAG